MREELDAELCEKYPKIFRDRNAPMTVTCMCWGFDIGDGWYPVINSLCGQIQNHIDWNNKTRARLLKDNPYNHKIPDEIPQVVATQVKEKFGGLRFYYEGGDSKIDGMVRMAESWAVNTCEECGSPGKTEGPGWIRTLCETHRNERNNRYKV